MYARVRRVCMEDGMTIGEAARDFRLHRDTAKRMLRCSASPVSRRRKTVRITMLGPYTGVIDRIPIENGEVPMKQRHTGKQSFELLSEEHGIRGGYTIVKDYVREHRHRMREMNAPLTHL